MNPQPAKEQAKQECRQSAFFRNHYIYLYNRSNIFPESNCIGTVLW